VKAVIQAVAETSDEFQPGDIFIHNDPYFGGSHLPDVNVVSPAFHGDLLLGFACVRAHWPDIGSATPGSYGAVTEIFGEGLRLPPVRLYAAGELNRDVDAIIFCNVRTPDERRGDLNAQIAANRRASARLSELAGKYGSAVLMRIMGEVMDYSDSMMRALLRDLPDGEGSFEDFCDGDGILEPGATEDDTFTIRMKVKKTGDRLVVDFAGSDPQVAGPMNAPLSVTASGVFTSVKMAVDPTGMIPPNSGCWRSVTVVAPEGSVVNASFPAPVVYANHEMSHRISDMMFGALADFMPDRVMACSQGTSAILTLGGVDYRTGGRYVSYETIKGGFGARPTKDGINCVASGISNTMNTPIEVLEMSFPVRVEYYEITADSGGAGKFRGGCAARRAWRILGNDSQAAVCCERTKSPPFGLAGGKAGTPMRISLETPDGASRELISKGGFTAPADSRVLFEVPGSGGYGAPSERDPESLRNDLRDGYVSMDGARKDYGVADPQALLDGDD
jgi:N-methylhydantoinase B